MPRKCPDPISVTVDDVQRLRDHSDVTAEGSASWELADAWFMTAVAISQQPCTLAEVVTAADAINHAILLDRQVDSLLSVLSKCELATTPWRLPDGALPTAIAEYRRSAV